MPYETDFDTAFTVLLGKAQNTITVPSPAPAPIPAPAPTITPDTFTMWFTLNGGASALTTADFVEAPIHFACVLTGYILLSRTSGTIVLKLGKATVAAYPTFTSIVASAPPTLSSQQKREDETLTGWTTSIDADTILELGVTSNASSLLRVSLGLRARRLS
jgi:hypothetical protein